MEIKQAPDRVKIWPFSAIDRPDGELAWSGGYWGNPSATMPHSTEYTRADLAQSQIKRLEAKLAVAVEALEKASRDVNWQKNSGTRLSLFVFDYIDAAIAEIKG